MVVTTTFAPSHMVTALPNPIVRCSCGDSSMLSLPNLETIRCHMISPSDPASASLSALFTLRHFYETALQRPQGEELVGYVRG